MAQLYNSLLAITPGSRTPSPTPNPTFDVHALEWPSLPSPQLAVQLQKPQPLKTHGSKPLWIKPRKSGKAAAGTSTPSTMTTSDFDGLQTPSSTCANERERRSKFLDTYRDYLTKWDQLFTVLREHESNHLLKPPSLRFLDIPWPVTHSSGDIAIFPLAQSIRQNIRRFLAMDYQQNTYYQLQFNLAIWGVLDFDRRVLPLVLSKDRWMASKLAHEIQTMLYVVPIIDGLGTMPYLRYRQDSVFGLQRFARLARHSADAPQANGLMLPFIFADRFFLSTKAEILTDGERYADSEP